jgi:membrane associated rhomboid family serine protease
VFFFFFPIGNESWISRLPRLTIGLIAVNILAFAATSLIHSRIERELGRLEAAMQSIEQRHLYRLAWEKPNLFHLPPDSLRQAIAQGEVIPEDDPDFLEWLSYYQKFQETVQSTPFRRWGFVPGAFNPLKIVTSMFLHGNIWHLLTNLVFLWLVGCNIEETWGWKVFGGIYLLSGISAALSHLAAFGGSLVPMIGASGAIAGVMGAYMVRHFRIKIRFFYLVLVIIRPFLGTVSLYAGLVLPIWFLLQFLGARWGSEDVAYWAHIGGFAFGAGAGLALRFLGLEKKYIDPMLDREQEKIKLSPKLAQAFQMLDAGDRAGARALLQQVMNQEPQNWDAPLALARLAADDGQDDIAGRCYNRTLELSIDRGDAAGTLGTFAEIKDRNLEGRLSERIMFTVAGMLEREGQHQEAAVLYHLFIVQYPRAMVRPKALLRLHSIYQKIFQDEARAAKVLEQLRTEHPDFPAPES